MSHAVSESTPLLPFFEGTNGHLDSSPIDIPYWSQVVLALTTSPDLVKASVVEKLEWYKNGSGFRHEYLVATVICPNHQKALCKLLALDFGCERTGRGRESIGGGERERTARQKPVFYPLRV
ncbi:hypothetical protein CPC08DRAFT_715486 [Agrocybe pediades]|nr:hypothetical protein CPC08DRAFT_715486 [Agrocybe pediades]